MQLLSLRQFFSPKPLVLDGVPCGTSIFQPGIELYEDGRLRSATLSEDLVRDGKTYPKGERVVIAPSGMVVRAR